MNDECDGVDSDGVQVSIWHRDITLVTPRQMKGGGGGGGGGRSGQKYSQYQRQAGAGGGQVSRQPRTGRQTEGGRQSSRQAERQSRKSSLVNNYHSNTTQLEKPGIINTWNQAHQSVPSLSVC